MMVYIFSIVVEDLDEDCGISIQRELEEMEKILCDENSFDRKGNLEALYFGA